MASTRAVTSKQLSSSTSSPKTPNKVKDNCICSTCLEEIIEPNGKKKGQQSILCNGPCNSWLHQQCAGLSKATFEATGSSQDHFYCPHCTFSSQKKDTSDLRALINNLSREVSVLRSEVTELKHNLIPTEKSINTQVLSDFGQNCHNFNLNLPSSNNPEPHNRSEKKLNLIFHGVPESPPGTSFTERLDKDVS